MTIKFGPAGIGSIKEIEKNFEEYKKLGIRTAEIPFTYGVYVKDKITALKIRNASEKFDIQLSIHAPYWINLNSKDLKKAEESKERILRSCEVGEWIGTKNVVFHCGYYEKLSKEETFENIKRKIKEMQEAIKKNKWKIKLAPETMGKVNVFGSVEEIQKLVEETNCSFCLDFAHIFAREKKIDWKKIEKLFLQKNWHCHFSGIEYGEKGEKHHRITKEQEWKNLLEHIPKNKNIVMINESPSPIEDSVKGLKLFLKEGNN